MLNLTLAEWMPAIIGLALAAFGWTVVTISARRFDRKHPGRK